MSFKPYDVVALRSGVPDLKLEAGTVGTVIEYYSENDVEIEFVDSEGGGIGLLRIDPADLRVPTTQELKTRLAPRLEDEFFMEWLFNGKLVRHQTAK